MKIFVPDFLDKPSEGTFIKVLYKVLVVILLAYIFQAAFIRSMNNYTDHDDNPYIAGAKITSEEGLLPYKDYRFIHMPYYVFAYAGILKFTPSLTFSARIISLASFLTILVVLFFSIQSSLSRKNQIFRFIVGASALIFLMYNPFVQYSFARFTYDFPLLLSILSFFILISLEKNGKQILKAAISGFLLGIAIGFRLHFIFLTVPFALSLFFFLKKPLALRLKLAIYFSMAVFVALIPVFILFLIAPKEFIFDIFQFHFNIDMKAQPGAALPLTKKLSNLFLMMREKWQSSVLLVGLFILIILKLFKLIKDDLLNFRINLLLLTLPFLIYLAVGKLVMIQYLYPLSFFLIITIFYGLAALKKFENYAALLVFTLSLLVLLGVNHKNISEINKPGDWNALERYRTSTLIDEATTGKVKVMTLSVAEVIESDSVSIYKEFVSSPFIYRTSHSIPDEEKEEFDIVSRKAVKSFMQENEPDAILAGYYPEDLETEIIEFAQDNEYTEIDLPTKRKLKLFVKKK